MAADELRVWKADRDVARRLGVGVVGGGFAGSAHLEAIRRTGSASSIVLAETSAAAAKAAGVRADVDAWTDDYRSLLCDDSVDVVHVCVPNALHMEVTKAALEAGKHVISEKPLAINSSDAQELHRLAEAAGLVNAVCFNYRFYPLVREARARVAEGRHGRPVLVHGGYLQDWLLFERDYNWRVDAAEGGLSRAVADIGSHWVDLASFLLGQPVTEVFAVFGRLHDRRLRPAFETQTFGAAVEGEERVEVETEDWASLLLRFNTGIAAQALVSQVSAGSKNDLWIQVDASEAAIRWEQERAEELWIGHRRRPNELLVKDPEILAPTALGYARLPGGHPEGWHDALTQLIRDVYDAVLHGTAGNYPTFADGLAAVMFVEAALRSSKSGRWEPVQLETSEANA